MIKNEKEFAATKKAIARYEEAIDGFDVLKSIEDGVDPIIANAQLKSYKNQIYSLKSQLAVYENFKNGNVIEKKFDNIRELGESIIFMRLANGWTQKQFADRCGLKEQQIQRYEKELYQSANLKRIDFFLSILKSNISGVSAYSGSKTDSKSCDYSGIDVSEFPISEMNKRGWFSEKIDLRKDKSDKRIAVLSRFFVESGGPVLANALHRKAAGRFSKKSTAALIVWQAMLMKRVREMDLPKVDYRPLSAGDISELVQLSRFDDGPIRAVHFLKDFGISLAFQAHLSGTKLDGAAMILDRRFPVIGMTLRHNRIDNFWFVLLHELAHLILHWEDLQQTSFLDEEFGDEADQREVEADEFASNSIISSELWNSSFVRFTKSEEAIVKFANRHNLHPALIAGKMRREQGYSLFSKLVTSVDVRDSIVSAKLWNE